MAVYSNFMGFADPVYESVLPDVDAESLLEDASIEPCFEDNFIVAGARICAENTMNMNSIMEACAIQEFCVYESTGDEMVYEGANGDGFFAKAKAFFLKLWQKIQGIFKKAIMMFNTKAKDDRAFFNKYKKEINAASNASYNDKEVAIYDYIFYHKDNPDEFFKNLFDNQLYSQFEGKSSGVLPKTVYDASNASESNLTGGLKSLESAKDEEKAKEYVKQIEDEIKKLNESDWKTDVYDTMRGNLVHELCNSMSGAVTGKEFSSSISEACQGGETTKDDVGMSTAVNYAATYLDKVSYNIGKALDNGLKDWKRSLDATVKKIEGWQKELKNDSTERSNKSRANMFKHSMMSISIQLMKETKNIGISYHSGIMQALKACSGQSKSICVQAVHYKKPKNESSVYTEEQTGSILDSIRLV